MNKKYLLSSVTAGIALLYANHGTAQCVSTQDCTALGYTETSCPNGNGVKCPFGNKWSCPSTETAPTPEQCTELGFTQSCTGTGYVGGSGTACSGKYKACSCAEGYAWKDGTCKPIRAVCEVGMLYYSDDSCSDKLYLGKTVLGVVIYSNGASGGGWIMTVNPIDRAIEWGGYGTDISGLTNIISQSNLTDIQASCTNTDIITAKGNSSTYPAAWAAKNYKPTGTPSGKSWCLPSGGLLNTALNNFVNFAKVNVGITTAGGTILGNVYIESENVWSSSEYNNIYAWYFTAGTRASFSMTYGGKDYYTYAYSVRPVMEFQVFIGIGEQMKSINCHVRT